MYKLIKASTDLGVIIDGARYGATKIVNCINNDNKYEEVLVKADHRCKSKDKTDMAKNLNKINSFNKRLYDEVYKTHQENKFPIIIGGDHSLGIASALADASFYGDVGIIWIDSHTDYNTFETTVTGNIHGLPLAAINRYQTDELIKFTPSRINPRNTVIVGARSVDPPEYVNIKKTGATIFSTEDIKKEGIKNILEKAFKIASNGTNKVHVSYDIDFIDPSEAPGVSVKAEDGIDKETAIKAMDIVSKHKDILSSLDIVEYNPLLDQKKETLKIASTLLKKFIQ